MLLVCLEELLERAPVLGRETIARDGARLRRKASPIGREPRQRRRRQPVRDRRRIFQHVAGQTSPCPYDLLSARGIAALEGLLERGFVRPDEEGGKLDRLRVGQ